VDYPPKARAEMTEPRKRKRTSVDIAKEMALGAAIDPLGLFFILLLMGKYWKVTLILLALVLTVGLITGFLMLWMNNWDI
jgi:hypothetical protein